MKSFLEIFSKPEFITDHGNIRDSEQGSAQFPRIGLPFGFRFSQHIRRAIILWIIHRESQSCRIDLTDSANSGISYILEDELNQEQS